MSLLAQLIAATPPPPDSADADLVLAAFAEMYATRQALITQLGSIEVDDEVRAQLSELAARDAAWARALATHRGVVEVHRGNTGKLRRYAATP